MTPMASSLSAFFARISAERIRRIKTRVPWMARNTVSITAMSLYFKHTTMRIPKEWME